MRNFLALTLMLHAGAAMADSGFYAGAGAGYYDNDFDIGTTDVDIQKIDLRMFYGYRFNGFLSLQADVIRSDLEIKANGTTVEKARPWLGEVSVKPSLPLGNDRAQVYLRAGHVFAIRDTVDAFDLDISDWSWAGGMEFFIDERWAVRAEYYGTEWTSDSFENGSFGLTFSYNISEGR